MRSRRWRRGHGPERGHGSLPLALELRRELAHVWQENQRGAVIHEVQSGCGACPLDALAVVWEVAHIEAMVGSPYVVLFTL